MGLRSAFQSAVPHNPKIIRSDPTVRALSLVSVSLGLMALCYTLFYLGPPFLVRYSPPPDKEPTRNGKGGPANTLVMWIEHLGPVWPVLFGIAAFSVLISTLLFRGLIVGHGIAAGVWVIYGSAIIYGAVMADPPSPILAGVAALFGAVFHVGMARAWAGEGVR